MSIRKIGKQGIINQAINKKIDKMFTDMDIRYCEAKLQGICTVQPITRTHRHKRDWYKGKVIKLLYDSSQVAGVCLACHMELEKSAELTEKVFDEIMERRLER